MKKNEKKRGRPRKIENWTAKILQDRALEYFKKCDSRTIATATKDGMVNEVKAIPYSVEGLCAYLDITSAQFTAWRKQTDALGERAAKIHLKITANRVEGALDGSQNSSFAQFMLKNNNPEDYRDRVEVENTVDEATKSILEMAVGSWRDRMKN